MTYPKMLLIAAGEDYTLSREEWQRRKDFWTGIGAFNIAFDGDVALTSTVTVEKMNQYELVIGNLDRGNIDKLLQLQEGRAAHVKWVSLIERCATDYLPADPRVKRLLDNSDLVNVINVLSLDFFRALTTARCEYIGMPYPFEGIRRKFYTPPERRKMRIMLPPFVDTPRVVHNASYLAAREAGIEMYGAQVDTFNYGDPTYHPLPAMGPIEYLRFVGESFCFMNLDHRYTWGRTVLECATLDIPCITTKSTGHWPISSKLLVDDEFDIVPAQDRLTGLLKNGFQYVTEFMQSEPYVNSRAVYMAEFTHERVAQKIMEALA